MAFTQDQNTQGQLQGLNVQGFPNRLAVQADCPLQLCVKSCAWARKRSRMSWLYAHRSGARWYLPGVLGS